MSRIRQNTILLVIVLLVAIFAGSYSLIAGVHALLTTPSSQPEGQPTPSAAASSTTTTITWSTTSTFVLLAPGQSNSEDLSFTSNANLPSVVIEAVPEIASFLAVQPSSLPAVPADQVEGIGITFSVPSGMALGLYSGTVHIRRGNQTLPQTLKVSIAVGTSVTNSALHLSFVIPPVGATPQTQVIQRSDGVTQIRVSALNATDEQPVPELELTLYPNPTSASLHDWFEQNVDVGGVLLSSNAFTLQQLPNGPALVRTAPVPAQYQGDPVDDAYMPSPSGDAIISVGESQVNDMAGQEYSQQQITSLSIGMLGTVRSF